MSETGVTSLLSLFQRERIEVRGSSEHVFQALTQWPEEGYRVLRGFDEGHKEAVSVCMAAREHGLLTRSIRNVIVLTPPFCITPSQLSTAIEAIRNSIVDVCGQTKTKP